MNDFETRVGQQIEQETAENPYLKDMLDVFLNTSKGDFLVVDSENFVENICVDESNLMPVKSKYHDTWKTVYMHYIRNAFHYLDDRRGQLIYIWYLKFKKAFGELDLHQTTMFTNKMIELYNTGFEFQDYTGEFKPPYPEGRDFQIMCHEIEEVKKNTV